MIIDYRRCMSVGMIPVIVAEVNGGIVHIRHCSWFFLCLSALYFFMIIIIIITNVISLLLFYYYHYFERLTL